MSPLNSKQIWNEAQNFTKFNTRKRSTDKGTTRFTIFKRSASQANVGLAEASSTIPSTASAVSSSTPNKVDFKLNSQPHNINNSVNNSNLLIIDKSLLINIDLDFLKQNFHQLLHSLNKQMTKFLEQFIELLRKNELNNTKQYEIVQDFYKKLNNYIQNHSSMKSYIEKITNTSINNSGNQSNIDATSINSLILSSASSILANNSSNNNNNSQQMLQNNEEIEKVQEILMMYVESCMTNSLYDYVFPSIMSEFEEKDIKLQKRIRNLYWITHEMIGTCLDENNILYRECYEDAISCM